MNTIHTKDMNELWRMANDKMLWATRKELDYVSSLDVMMVNCMGVADSAKFNLNIGRDLWLTPVRWTTLLRQYIDPDRFDSWLEGCVKAATGGRGVNAMDMKGVNETVVANSRRASRRKWGGCMRMVTFRGFPQPTISLFSRTSYLGYIGGLDMLVAHKLAAAVGERIDVPVKDFAFVWHCDAWQFHGFKSMAYIFASGQEKFLMGDRPKLEAQHPTWKLVRGWFKRITKKDDAGELYSEMKYSAERRIRRRYHATLGDEQYADDDFKPQYPLDVPIKSLSLEKMRR